ncbi:hypothetical protein [Poriferisphaera sp. WC338]|uniref:hypothetical protein n=1 Tax=Poriferisphaera sp. WC338 TaxID=3425129 RepID=UPI003D81AD87
MRKLTTATAIALSLGVIGSTNAAIDGIADANERANMNRSDVNFDFEGTSIPNGTGNLWSSFDAEGNLHVIFEVSRQYVDNTWGDESHVSWRTGGKGKEHKLKELDGSDDADFVITNSNGQSIYEFSMDFLAGSVDDFPLGSSSSKDAGKGKKDKKSKKGKGGKNDTNIGGNVIDAATSLEYNLSNFGSLLNGEDNSPDIVEDFDESVSGNTDPKLGQYTLVDNNFDGWEFSVIYEALISKDLFASNTFGGVMVDDVHASPAKNKLDGITTTPPNPPSIPSPSAAFGGMLLLGSLVAKRTRKTS